MPGPADQYTKAPVGGTNASTALVLALVFALSVAVRAPRLASPLARHHEAVTGHALRILEIWREEGGARCRFLPIMNYGRAADKNIPNHATTLRDAQGNYYDGSYGPLAYIAPYCLFTALGTRPNELGIRLFGLLVHLLTAVLVYAIVNLLVRTPGDRLPWPAIGAFSVYALNPLALWCHMSVYSVDTVVQPLFAGGIYLALLVMTKRGRSTLLLPALAALTCAMVLTEWLGVFLAFSVAAYGLWRIRGSEGRRLALWVAAAAAAGAIVLAAWYSEPAGLRAFWRECVGKYEVRSGLARQTDEAMSYANPRSVLYVGYYVYQSFAPMLAALALVWIGIRRLRPPVDRVRRPCIGPGGMLALYLATVPALLHHLAFYNFTAIHDFALVKDVLPLSIATGLLLGCLLARTKETQERAARRTAKAAGVVVALALAAGVARYWWQNSRPGDEWCLPVAAAVRRAAADDEVVFLKGPFTTQMVWYSGRNIASYTTLEEALRLIKMNGVHRGVLFIVDPRTKQLVQIAHIHA